jgi:hypothetical protein
MLDFEPGIPKIARLLNFAIPLSMMIEVGPEYLIRFSSFLIVTIECESSGKPLLLLSMIPNISDYSSFLPELILIIGLSIDIRLKIFGYLIKDWYSLA